MVREGRSPRNRFDGEKGTGECRVREPDESSERVYGGRDREENGGVTRDGEGDRTEEGP